jgi:phage terminase small subunit
VVVGRQRSPDRDKAFEIYKKHKGNIDLIEIAKLLNLSDGTIRGWKNKDKWNDKLNRTFQNNTERSNKKKSVPKQEWISKVEQKQNNSLEVDELTERQRLFAEIFVRSPIAYKAAIKAGYAPDSAHAEGSRLLRNVKVRNYINYLKELKRESLMLDIEDLVDLNMRIAFADIKDYTEFGQEYIPVISNGEPIKVKNPSTGEEDILTQKVNTVKLKESFEVDGEIISEIKASKQGTSIKLEDRRKAIQWLTDYFGWNPEHRHKKEFDAKKLELEKLRFEHQKKMDESKVW